jgi:hypothetical protein
MNFNPNFSAYCLDFIPALKLVKAYVKGFKKVDEKGEELPMILSNTALQFVHKVGLHTANLEQKVLALKVLYRLLETRNQDENLETIMNLLQARDVDLGVPKTHDSIILGLVQDTVLAKFGGEKTHRYESAFWALARHLTSFETVQPNLMEQHKLLATCLALRVSSSVQ